MSSAVELIEVFQMAKLEYREGGGDSNFATASNMNANGGARN